MKLLNIGVTLLLLLVLAACASVTPEPELEAGVDEHGPYTVIASKDSDGELAPTAAFTPTGRRIELRKYSDGRYSTYLIVNSGSNHVSGAGHLGLTFVRGSQQAKPAKRFDLYMEKYKTWNGNTGAVKPPFTPERVCARVTYERFSSNNQGGGSDLFTGGSTTVCD